MEHSPPLFFKTGPTPLARLLIFSALSLAFLVADARFNYLVTLRQVAAVIVYPFQRIATAPAGIARRIGEFFVTHGSLREENSRLTRENFGNAALLLQREALRMENTQLRELLSARSRLDIEFNAAEVLYAARDPFTRKVVIDKGSQHEVRAGQAVVDNRGVIGQVTRVYPWLAEITLVTDKPPRNGPNPAPAPQSQLSLDGEPASLLDSSSAERVQTVVRGLRDLRDQAHEILEILRRNP